MPLGNWSIEAVVQGGGAAPTTRVARGGALGRTGAGVYTVTLDRALNLAEGVCYQSPQGAAAAANSNAELVHTSDTVKTISCFVAAVATDMEIGFIAIRVSDTTG